MAGPLLLAGVVSSGATPRSQQTDIATEATALLKRECVGCHGADRTSGLDLRSRNGALEGGNQGPAIVPGQPDQSRLFRRVSGAEEPAMPMGGRLRPQDVDLLRRWIATGATWELPATEPISSHTGSVTSSYTITKKDRDWWAFKKPVRHPVPEVTSPRWSKNPIDAFLYQKFEEMNLAPVPAADRRTLIRRAYLDLIGLLPSPREVEAFVQDKSPDAFARVVDRLLASQHYGERWGRHWLDVARYGDSGGYEHDFEYPHAWRYRDYVIRAFNQDKPYDQFIREQVAGDELDEVTHDSLIATGFHRVLATVGYREKDNPQYRYTYLNDMITTTSRGFMALSVECARCHDHKFDPIPQIDYYRMMAVFFSFIKYDHNLAPPDEVARYESQKAEIEKRIQPLKDRIREIEAPYREITFAKTLASFPEDIQRAVRTPEDERSPGQKLLADQVLSIRAEPSSELVSEANQAEIASLREQIRNIEEQMPEPLPVAMGVRDGDYRFAPDGAGDEVQPGKGDREFYNFEGSFLPDPAKPYQPPPAHFLPTADYRQKGPEVQPGLLQILTEGNPPRTIQPSNNHVTTGRRRALAQWLASKEHPLTARVMVNRIWHHHFGRGLVATPSNFGRMGQRPSHPELLDWLATEFVRQQWSIKQMHVLIMTSEAYRMTAHHNPAANTAVDADNVYLWRYRQRRLEAEAIRDIILAASGKLNRQLGGPPFYPPVAPELLEAIKKGWKLTREGPDVWRRSVYSTWRRGLRYPLFDVLDLPSLNVTCERRTTTTVPTQALTLLNNQFVLSQARYFAERVGNEAGREPSDQIQLAYQIALSRDPTPKEMQVNLDFLQKQMAYHEKHKKSDAGSEALIDMCDVLLNLNEFVYVN